MELRIHTSYPNADIRYNWPRLEIDGKLPELRVDVSGPKVTIDQSEAWAEIGFRERPFLNKELKELSRAALLRGIRRYAQDGDRIVRSLGKVDMRRIAGQIVKERDRGKIPELNVQVLPKSRPKVEFEYSATIDWLEGWLSIDVLIDPPQIAWQMGSVETTVVGTQYDGRG